MNAKLTVLIGGVAAAAVFAAPAAALASPSSATNMAARSQAAPTPSASTAGQRPPASPAPARPPKKKRKPKPQGPNQGFFQCDPYPGETSPDANPVLNPEQFFWQCFTPVLPTDQSCMLQVTDPATGLPVCIQMTRPTGGWPPGMIKPQQPKKRKKPAPAPNPSNPAARPSGGSPAPNPTGGSPAPDTPAPKASTLMS